MPNKDLGPVQPSREQIIATAISRCNAKEQAAYKYFLAGLARKESFEIPSIKADELYVLFSNGKTCDEIRKLSGSAFSLGQVVAARIVWGWDEKLDQHRRELIALVPDHVSQTRLESADVISDLIAACNLKIRGQIQKYLQSGNDKDLIGTPLEKGVGLKTYETLLELLGKVTGADQQTKKTESKVTVTHSVEAPVRKVLDPERAGSLLDELVPDKK